MSFLNCTVDIYIYIYYFIIILLLYIIIIYINYKGQSNRSIFFIDSKMSQEGIQYQQYGLEQGYIQSVTHSSSLCLKEFCLVDLAKLLESSFCRLVGTSMTKTKKKRIGRGLCWTLETLGIKRKMNPTGIRPNNIKHASLYARKAH